MLVTIRRVTLTYILLTAWAVAASAQQQIPQSSRRALMVAQFAQEAAEAEVASQALQTQLSQAQKQIEELKAKCGDPCKLPDTPK